jgi:PAS domain S-box-containing protein
VSQHYQKDLQLISNYSAFEAISTPVLVVTDRGNVRYGNSAAQQVLGIDFENVRTSRLADLIPATDVLDFVKPALTGTDEWLPPTVEFARKDGSRRYLEISAARWHHDSTEVLYALVANDVTKRQEALAELQSTTERVHYALEGAKIGVFELDVVTGTSIVSDTWRTLMGVEDLSSKNGQALWRARIHPQDMAMVNAADAACIEGHKDRSVTTYRMRSSDDTHWRWMRSDVVAPSRDQFGRALRLIGAQTDVTQTFDTERELRRSEEQFRSSFEYGPIGVAILGMNGAWLRVNPALCKMFGYSEADLLVADFQTFTHPDDLGSEMKLLNRMLDGVIQTYQLEKRYFRSNGDVLWGMVSVALIRDDAGAPEHFVSQIIDITEEKRIDELKSEFVATVSHELRTPLTSIIGALKLVSGEFAENLPDAAQRLLYIAEQNGDRLHVLINDMLDYEKLSVGPVNVNLSSRRIGHILDEAILANLSISDAFGVNYNVVCTDRALEVLVDAKRFHQIMTNLLSNAAKFAFGGSTIDIHVLKKGSSACLSVTNEGDGIPESFKALLFQPFSQAASTSTRKHGGTGLGLSITQKIVEQMGGAIGYESVEGEKTTFWFTVPLNNRD